MKILITGGHVTPALAVIDTIRGKGSDEVIFVGRRYAQTDSHIESYEYAQVTARGIEFIPLDAGRLNRSISMDTVRGARQLVTGFRQARAIVSHVKPDVVLSFGSYLAVPIAYHASRVGIPVYTHEQTLYPGLSNRLIGRFARKIFVSFPETARYFKGHRVVHTGNPLRPQIFDTSNPSSMRIPTDRPVLYITGGSLGSRSINEHIREILPSLVARYTVIHQSGSLDYHALSKYSDKRYILKSHIGDDEIGTVYAHADVVIARAGANTVFELVALHKPSVLIPLPWAAHDEQRRHAKLLKAAGVAEIFEQADSSRQLLDTIHHVVGHTREYCNFTKLEHYIVPAAAERIYEEIH